MTLEEAQERRDDLENQPGGEDSITTELLIDKIYADFKIELEEAKAQGFREAIKEMGKVKGV